MRCSMLLDLERDGLEASTASTGPPVSLRGGGVRRKVATALHRHCEDPQEKKGGSL